MAPKTRVIYSCWEKKKATRKEPPMKTILRFGRAAKVRRARGRQVCDLGVKMMDIDESE
jgi:hypothetical protein